MKISQTLHNCKLYKVKKIFLDKSVCHARTKESQALQIKGKTKFKDLIVLMDGGNMNNFIQERTCGVILRHSYIVLQSILGHGWQCRLDQCQK